MLKCAECPHHGCQVHDVSNAMICCPTKNGEIQQQASELYKDAENYTLAHNAAVVEAEGYGRLCRMEEIMLFARKCGYNRIGLIFCVGLSDEAREVSKILTHNGFDVVSAVCKNGSDPKSSVGLKDEETLSGCALKIGAFLEMVRRPKKNIPLRRHTKKGRSRPRSSRVPFSLAYIISPSWRRSAFYSSFPQRISPQAGYDPLPCPLPRAIISAQPPAPARIMKPI